jgi:hypothetical protein
VSPDAGGSTVSRDEHALDVGTDNPMRSQLLFRELNEQIRSLAEDDEFDLICECVNRSCYERLTLSLDVYETVRRFPTRFVVKPGHADATERVAETDDGHLVVEKIGVDAESAILFDPRRRSIRRERVG